MSNNSSWEVAPVLRVRDVRASAAYYQDKLGFEFSEESIVDGVGDEGAVYAIGRRNGVAIHLGRARTGYTIDPGQRPNAIGAYFFVSGVKELHRDFVECGADVLQEPAATPYGLEEMIVRDPDGYSISFGAPA